MEVRDQKKRIDKLSIIIPNIIKMYFNGLSLFLFIEKTNKDSDNNSKKGIKISNKEIISISLHYYAPISLNITGLCLLYFDFYFLADPVI